MKMTLVSTGAVEDRWAWSGIPWGLAEGLARAGVTVQRVSADLPWLIEKLGAAAARRIPGGCAEGSDNAQLVFARNTRLRRLLSSTSEDIVLGMGSTVCYPGLYVTFEDQTVAQSPFAPSRAKDRWIRRQAAIYRSALHCLATTPWAKESIVSDYGVPEGKVTSVGLGANIVCRPVPKNWDQPKLLWVGVDWRRKGGDLLLEAFAHARIPGASLDIVGRHPRIDAPGVRGHGVIRDENRLRQFYEAATLFVLPSVFDPSPIVFLEAASAGTPCIGTDTGGTRYSVGQSGEVVMPNDVRALVGMLRKMTVPAIAKAYCSRAVVHAAAHTWDAVAERVLAAIGWDGGDPSDWQLPRQ
jgi:glycosyltransferase involved in cell wall biosynthesis